MSILIVTCSYDLTSNYIQKRYESNYTFFRLNIDEVNKFEINVNNKGFSIKNKETGRKIYSTEITSIYYRKIDFPNLDEYEPEDHVFIKKEILAFVDGIVNSFEGKVLTKPAILRNSENKVNQLMIAERLGIKQPKTSITNSSEYINKIIGENKWILKPMASGRIRKKDNSYEVIQTNIVDREVNEIEKCPTYFQEYITKEYELRITVINNKIFPVKITNQDKIDWRKSGPSNKFEICKIPKNIEKECLKILSELKLDFGAFDYIYTGREYIFLEVNPNGQWLWLEEELGLNISEEIVSYLKG